MSRSPTPSKTSFVSKFDSHSHTPSSSITDQIEMMLTHKTSEYDVIDKYKMKEIKQYVANEIFKN